MKYSTKFGVLPSLKTKAFCVLLIHGVLFLSVGPTFAQDDFSADDSDVVEEIESSESAGDAAADSGDIEDFEEFEEGDNSANVADEKTKEAPPEEAEQDDLMAEEEKKEEPKEQEEVAAPEEEAPEQEEIAAPEPIEAPEETETPPTEELVTQAESPSTTGDEPDLNYEAKLHNIFLNFHNAKTPEEEWGALLGARNAERYTIQRGDTLWDISRTLFGDGNYWPKVWSLNSNITNPHYISPNNSIRFILGDESEPPAFTVTENATDSSAEQPVDEVVSEQTVKSTVPVTAGEIEIPPPLKPSRRVVKNIPPSLPEWQDVARLGDFDESGISYARRKIADVVDSIPLASFISEAPPEALGEVKEIEVGNNIASAFQYIYVSMKSGSASIGDTFLAVSNRGPLVPGNRNVKGFLGYSIDVQGEVQIVEKVDARKAIDGRELYRALVLKIVNPVSLGAFLTKGKIESVNLSENGERSQVVAQVIGGSFFNKRQVFGNESIAYLNRGANDGLQEGQILPIRANRLVRNEETLVGSNVRPIGWLKIIKTTPRFATAVVLRAWSDVLSGDLTGSGSLLPEQVMQNVDNAPKVSQQAGDIDSEFDTDSASEVDMESQPVSEPEAELNESGQDSEFDE